MDMEKKEQLLFTTIQNSLNEEQQQDLQAILSQCDDEVTLTEKINIAFGVKNGMYTIFRDVNDMYDVGVAYIKNKHPDLPEMVLKHTDFEELAFEFDNMGGTWAGNCYIYNFDEAPEVVYNGNNADELIAQLEQAQTNTDRYVEYINENILSKIDYDLLQASYNTKDKNYAKAVLNALHSVAVQIYGTNYFDGHDGNEYVLIPGIVRSREKGNICVALLEIDLLSSGEHCNTVFLTKYGCLEQFDEKRPKEVTNFLRNTYSVYDYAYTLGIEHDHHVDFENLHPDMAKFLETSPQYSFIPKGNEQNTDTQDFER